VRTSTSSLLACLCLLASTGCGGGDGRFNAQGRIVKGGVPFTVPEDDTVRVTFFPVTADGRPPANTYASAFNGADGTFRAVGRDGKGLPPGKYRIAIEHQSKRKERLRGDFDGDRSPFVFDIDSKSKEILIDLNTK
jgi:hypothetical protein